LGLLDLLNKQKRAFSHKKFLIFGGTGSLGKTLVKRLKGLSTPITPISIAVFSRDEAKHHHMRLDFPDVEYIIGDIRSYESVLHAIRSTAPDIIINAAALKQVPTCEFYPYEAIMTNTIGTRNLVKAVEEHSFDPPLNFIRKVLSISTDKACKPVNSYGMTKALQERIHLNGKRAVYNCVRYGNVLESTGSVIPVFQKLLKDDRNLTITDERMTRFLLSLDESVDLIFKALVDEDGGKIFIPKIPSAKITDLAEVMIDHHPCKGSIYVKYTGIRPGEKLDEILVSEEEVMRTEDLGDTYVIHDIKSNKRFDHLSGEYSSKDCLMAKEQLEGFLKRHGVV
jgi:UDP-glucose 4-epimerase